MAGRSASWWRCPTRLERQRIASALANEGFVLEVESTADALARLADESFDLAFLTLDEEGRAIRSRRRASCAPSPTWCSSPRAIPTAAAPRSAARWPSVLPRPLPEVDALLRAHVKRLAGFRRSRTRGLLVMNAFAGIRPRCGREVPALAAAIDLMVAEAGTSRRSS